MLNFLRETSVRQALDWASSPDAPFGVPLQRTPITTNSRKRLMTRRKVLAPIGVLAAAILVTTSCGNPNGMPELAGLPPQLKPFAQKIADSRLAYVDATPVIRPTTPWDSKLRGVPYY